jgi:hypothetical protein
MSRLVGRKPERKPFGRDGPPRGYPKDQSQYADPENWRYPLHTSWHARAARRYFDDPSNRNKYSSEEQEYIDSRIDQALQKLGVQAGTVGRRKRPSPITSPSGNQERSLEQLLRLFLGDPRLQRAREIDDSLVSISQESSGIIEGKVKDYSVRIDFANHTVLHDCQDWRNNVASKNMCKHLGKFLLTLDEEKATEVLKQVLKDIGKWSFIAPDDPTD